MNKNTYRKLLKHPLWFALRAKILKRDHYKCCGCGAEKSLQVHHQYYIDGRLPWEYKRACFLTLCASCHRKAHRGRKISSFFIKVEPVKKRK